MTWAMLFKLSARNIKRSIKDYTIYFFTLALGVAIFYIFNAIGTQTVMMKMSESKRAIVDLLESMLGGVSVFVAFILGFLIVYASVFLIKRRKKEFGVYMTLGMSRGKISKLLFFETLMIGVMSLIIGLAAGIGLSQLMSVIVAHMFEADMTQFTFTVSTNAIMKTLICFGIMYVIVIIFNTISVSRCKLIHLLNASKRGEKLKLKNPIICIIIFLLAAGILGYAYYQVTAMYETLTDNKIYLMIALGCIGTFLVFWSLSGLILKIAKSCKRLYFKKLNSFVLRQTSSKMNTTVFSMTVICLMLFVTICVLSCGLSINDDVKTNLKTLCPVDFYASRYLYKEDTLSEQEAAYMKYSDNEILESIGLDPNNDIHEKVSLYVYHDENLTIKTTTLPGSVPDNLSYVEDIIPISDYNRLAELYGKQQFSLDENQYLIIADFQSVVEIRNKALESGLTITLGNKSLTPKYKMCQDGFLSISSNHINSGFIVVPDDAVVNCNRGLQIIAANYAAQTDAEREKIENKIISDESKLPQIRSMLLPSVTTRIAIYESSVGLGAIVVFIGIYLGFIFLISSAAILALKELSEAADNKIKYSVLRDIGADEKMINRALLKQIAIFFLVPLFFACFHSIFGILFAQHMLQTFGGQSLGMSVILAAVIIVLIYGGYFLITYFCSKNMIKEK